MHFRPSHIARGLLVGLLLLTAAQPARAAGLGDYTAPFQSMVTAFENIFGNLVALVEPHHTVTVEISPAAMGTWHASGKTASAAAFNSILATSQPAASPTIVHIDTAPKTSTPALHTIVTASSISPAPLANLAGYVTQAELSAQLSDLTSQMHDLIYNQNAQSTSSLYSSLWGALALSQKIDSLPSTVTVGGSTVVTQSSLPALSGMSGLLGISQGGTGTTTAPAYGQILMGDGIGGYTLMATSSLGLAAGGSNPWTLSGSNVTYAGGNVGIGTTTIGTVGTTTTSAALTVNGKLDLAGSRGTIYFRGDNTTDQVGGLQLDALNYGQTTVITPTDASGNTLNGSIQFGGNGAFNSNVVNLTATGNIRTLGSFENTRTINYSGTQSAANTGLYLVENAVGTTTDGFSAPLNFIDVSDTMGEASTTNASIDALDVIHNFGGPGTQGFHSAFTAVLNQVGTSSLTTTPGAQKQYVSGSFGAKSNYNDGGVFSLTDPTQFQGDLYGINPNVELNPGASNWGGLVGQETDVAIQPGASAASKIGIVVVQTSADAVAGTFYDTAFGVANQLGSAVPGWQYAYSVGSPTANWPISTTTGTILGVYTRQYGGSSPDLAAYGVNLTGVTFNQAAFKSNGFAVDGSGNITAKDFFASSTNSVTAGGIGSLANYFNTSSTAGETAFGYLALGNATSSTFDTAFGYQALKGSATVTAGGGNSAFGYNVLLKNTSGTNDQGFGASALLNNTSGSFNNAFGANALNANSTGGNNSAFGHFALSTNVSGSGNSGFGAAALLNDTSSGNSAFGGNALLSLTSGSNNSGFGFNALKYLTTGTQNTAFGYQAGVGVTAASDYNSTIDANMTFVGYEASRSSSVASTTQLTNGTAIGYLAAVGCSNCLVLGGTGGNAVNVGIGTTTLYSRLTVWGADTASSTAAFTIANSASTTEFAVFDGGNAQLAGTLTQNSDQRLKTNIQSLDASSSLAAIDALNPVTFNWINPTEGTTPQLGFIAQQVQQLFPALIATTSPTPLTPGGTLGLNYIGLISPIVSAIQALSAEVTSLEATVAGFAESFTSAVGNFGKVNTQQLCVGDGPNDSSPVCVTKSQLAAILAGSSQPSVQISAPTPLVISGTTTPPSINIQGSNPATIHVGDTYTDLGAIATDNQGHDLGYKTFLNGALVSNIIIDATKVATDTIDYVATDTWGNTATSTRTVIVEAAPSIVPATDATTTDSSSPSGAASSTSTTASTTP